MTSRLSNPSINGKAVTVQGKAKIPAGVVVRVVADYRNAAGKIIARAQTTAQKD
jgi:hypothetical protein